MTSFQNAVYLAITLLAFFGCAGVKGPSFCESNEGRSETAFQSDSEFQSKWAGVQEIKTTKGWSINSNRPGPVYPASALMKKHEGYVICKVHINDLGYVEDYIIIESCPRNVFDSSAIAYIKSIRYTSDDSENPILPSIFTRRFNWELPD